MFQRYVTQAITIVLKMLHAYMYRICIYIYIQLVYHVHSYLMSYLEGKAVCVHSTR
jgi:hypothetical protein